MVSSKPTVVFDHVAVADDRLSESVTQQNGTHEARNQSVPTHSFLLSYCGGLDIGTFCCWACYLAFADGIVSTSVFSRAEIASDNNQ